jgi:hypothetical protein
MRHRPMLSACMALLAVAGCGDGAVAPGPGSDGVAVAARFEHLADSVDGAGYSPTADALRHAAEIVRLTGHATPVALTIDGATRTFHAVAEQLDFPNLECTWPSDSGVVVPGDSGLAEPPSGGVAEPVPGDCEVIGTFSMRTLIAWEPDDMAEVVRIVADPGSNGFGAGVPDVMTGLPTTVAGSGPGEAPPAPGDSAGGGGGGGDGTGYPGFMGEYLVRDVGSWWAVEGTQANELKALPGSCTADRADIDWAEFSCEAARFGFQFDMRVEPVRYEPLTGREPAADPAPGGGGGGPEGSHALAMGASEVDGVRLTVVAWTPPPLPPDSPSPPPVDSTARRES